MTAQTILPRWRGFNLLEFFHPPARDFVEQDFQWMTDWGFDFARIPMDYRLWLVEQDPFSHDEAIIEKIDQVVRFGEKYGVHIDLNFHTAPGYCVNRGKPLIMPNLWKNQKTLDAFIFQWEFFARRYKGLGHLSFNLVNEPPFLAADIMNLADYIRVTRAATDAIRAVDPERLVIADGCNHGRIPCPDLADIAQSTRAYEPHSISHYLAHWAKGMDFPVPTWPETSPDLDKPFDRDRLRTHYAPWIDMAQNGTGVHCGEGGAYQHTPHDVFLRWFGDVLDILTEAGIGWALWNLRGPFGVINSERPDVDYEEFHGYQLDRQLLELLKAH